MARRNPCVSLSDTLANLCGARSALAAGQFVASYTSDALIAAENDDVTALDTFDDGQLQDVPIGMVTPHPAPLGAAADTAEPVHAYGDYLDPATSVESTLSAGAYTLTEAESDVTSWVNATITGARHGGDVPPHGMMKNRVAAPISSGRAPTALSEPFVRCGLRAIVAQVVGIVS